LTAEKEYDAGSVKRRGRDHIVSTLKLTSQSDYAADTGLIFMHF